ILPRLPAQQARDGVAQPAEGMAGEKALFGVAQGGVGGVVRVRGGQPALDTDEVTEGIAALREPLGVGQPGPIRFGRGDDGSAEIDTVTPGLPGGTDPEPPPAPPPALFPRGSRLPEHLHDLRPASVRTPPGYPQQTPAALSPAVLRRTDGHVRPVLEQ